MLLLSLQLFLFYGYVLFHCFLIYGAKVGKKTPFFQTTMRYNRNNEKQWDYNKKGHSRNENDPETGILKSYL